MFLSLFRVLFLLFVFACYENKDAEGIYFTFKGRDFQLLEKIKLSRGEYFPHSFPDDSTLDTMSNWYNPVSSYVEIIRQDDGLNPAVGLALGFEFDEAIDSFPFTPAMAVLQLKNFNWGGVMFSSRDTMNYTGVFNEVSEDIIVVVDGFQHDTIWGRFSGLLVNGAGTMESLGNGSFKVKVYRVE